MITKKMQASLIFLIILISTISFIPLANSATKSFEDTVSFSAVGTKLSAATATHNWVPANSCPGTQQCYLQNISVYRRYINAGSGTTVLYDGYTQIANTALSNCADSSLADFTGARYISNAPLLISGEVEGPKYDCGNVSWSGTPTTCNLTLMDGYNNSKTCLSLKMFGQGGGAGKSIVINDITRFNYTWNWYVAEPTLETPLVYPSTGGWGTNFSMNVTAYDPQIDDIYIRAWWRHTAGDVWKVADGRYNATGCSSSNKCNVTIFLGNLTCSDIDSDLLWKFNATDNTSNPSNEVGGTGSDYINVIADNSSLNHILGNETRVNRSNAESGNIVLLVTRINDTVRGRYIDASANARVYTSYDEANTLKKETITASNGFGNISYNFNPTCLDDSPGDPLFVVGPRKWSMGVLDSCYLRANSSEFNVTVVGSFTARYNDSASGSTYNLGDTINIEVNVTDDCGTYLTGLTFNNFLITINGTGFSDNCSSGEFSELGAGNYRCAWSSTGAKDSWYDVIVKVSKNYYNNATIRENNAFRIIAPPNIFAANIDPASDGWGGSYFNFSINVTDLQDNVTVRLYISKITPTTWLQVDGAKNCTNCSNQPMTWNYTFTCGDVADWKFKFNATDLSDNSDETTAGDCIVENCYFTVRKDQVNISHIAGNNSQATLIVPALFSLKVFDMDKNSNEISETLRMQFNVSTTALESPFKNVGFNTTNSSGGVIYRFLPNEDFTKGTRRWFGYVDTLISTCYQFNITDNYTVNVIVNFPPKYENVSLNGLASGVVAGWGEDWNFSLIVKDADGDDVNISLEVDTGDGFQELDKKYCEACTNPTSFNFSINFDCEDINSTAKYKFSIIDNNSNPNVTSEITFNIDKDDITIIHIFGNDTTANRTGDQIDLLSVRLNDTDNGTYVNEGTNVTFTITLDGLTPDSGYINGTNASGYATDEFNPGCTPKYQVGNQRWIASVSNAICYKDATSANFNLTVKGDIVLEINKPDGTANFTQEASIPFLGSTVDDCADALASTVRFYANKTSVPFGYYAGTVTKIGANAYSADFVTNISVEKGFYNVSMIANSSNHYNNYTIRSHATADGLFYLFAVRKLEYPNATPISEGWGYSNWNFSIVASSGDSEFYYNLSVKMGTSWPPATTCNGSVCFNQTLIECIAPDCINSPRYWIRNFSSSDILSATIFYAYYMDGKDTTDTIKSVTIEKDNTIIEYADKGNASSIKYLNATINLSVKVKDTDKNTYYLNPNTLVSFYLLHSGYVGGEKYLGAVTTNASGYADIEFNITDCTYRAGTNNWRTVVNSSDVYYKANQSDNFTVILDMTGCEAAVAVEQVLVPTEAFQFRNITINTTLTSYQTDAKNVTAYLIAPYSWIISNRTASFASITEATFAYTSFYANITNYGTFNVTVMANSSNAGNSTLNSSFFKVYKYYPERCPASASNGSQVNSLVCTQDGTYGQDLDNPAQETKISPNGELIADFPCNASTQRIANVFVNWESNNTDITKARLYTYSSIYSNVVNSINVGTNISNTTIKLLRNQLFVNESYPAYCRIKIQNVGGNDLYIDYLELKQWYAEAVRVQDVAIRINQDVITGMETSDGKINATIMIGNSINTKYYVDITLNITNSSNAVISANKANIQIPANETIYYNFTNINTSTWTQDTYSLKVFLSNSSNFVDNRTESFIFRNVTVIPKTISLICNNTIEFFNITVTNRFTDVVSYNATLIASGWTFAPSSIIYNTSTVGNFTVEFNITSSQTEGNVNITALVTYTYPSSYAKTKTSNLTIENNASTAILSIYREIPYEVANSTEFYSRLIVYNKGCAAANEIDLTEKVSSGWTAFAPTLDGESAGITDIPNGEIRFSSTDFGTILAKEYKIIAYKIFSPSELRTLGSVRYNLSYDGRNNYEEPPTPMKIMNYTQESLVSFDITAVGSSSKRAADPSANQYYALTIYNNGDKPILNQTWNVTVKIPSSCNASNYTGIFNTESRKINWLIGPIEARRSINVTFNMNCTTEDRYLLYARGINQSEVIETVNNVVNFGCSGTNCYNTTTITLSKPSNDYPEYTYLSELDFLIGYAWQGQGLTIGQGYVNVTDDNGGRLIVWQNWTQEPTSGLIWSNFSISPTSTKFIEATRNMTVASYADATYGATGNVTIKNITSKWMINREYDGYNNLFVNIKTYVYVPDAPILTAPLNNSAQAAEPVGLSWIAPTAPSGVNLTYYVYGDNSTGESYLDSTETTVYLWRNIPSGTYKWKVKASTGTQNSSYSQTWQFSLDLCTPDTAYSYALNYSMSYDNSTDKITVWGSNGTGGYTVLGNNDTNPITFEHIYQFGKAKRGTCAVTKPATGTYAILTKLDIGNTSDLFNTTYVKTSGESISFNKQVIVRAKANFISGLISPAGNPYSGSTLAFSGTDANSSLPGQLYPLPESSLKLYDTMVIHKTARQYESPWLLYFYGNVIAKRTSFQNWAGIALRANNNSLDDIVFTDVIHGLHPDVYQIGIITNIISRFADNFAFHLRSLYAQGNNVTISNLQVDESEMADIKVENYTGVANLVNPTLNFSRINWSTGTFSGSINRRHTYSVTIEDSTGTKLSNATLRMLDVRGAELFKSNTDAQGQIASQTITRAIYDYAHKTGDERGPHTFKAKKYGKTFQTIIKTFSAATIETLQLATNPFVTATTEAQARNQTGIVFAPPQIISFGNEINSTFTTAGQLRNIPITQSEYFVVFGYDGTNNNTKLTLVTDEPNSNGEYKINYATGALTFYNDQTGKNVTSVYSYKGNITIVTGTASANCISMNTLYDYMQANLSDVLTTVDGTTYTMYVNLIIGNSTVGGCIVDSDAALEFEDGYTYSFGPMGGYIDLYGVTEGGGAGGLPLNIRDAVGSTFNPGDFVEIFSFVFDSNGAGVNANVIVNIDYPNGTIFANGTSNPGARTGDFKFNATLGTGAPLGIYNVRIDATYLTYEVHDTLVFQVEAAGGGGGGQALNIESSTGTLYSPGDEVTVLSTTTDSEGAYVNASVTTRALYPNGSTLSTGSSTLRSSGRFNYSFILPLSAPVGTYSVETDASYSGNEAHDQDSFVVSKLIESLGNGFSVYMSDVGEVAAGQQYRTKVWVFDINGSALDADSIPRITLYDPLRNPIVDDVSMTRQELGIYIYNFTTSTTHTAGTWESIASVIVRGSTVKPSDFWELESSVADAIIYSITDTTIPTITANIGAKNAGTQGSDFEIFYCIVTTASNNCGGGDDVDSGSQTLYISAGQTLNLDVTLNVQAAGDYFFKLVVRPVQGTEKAGASKSFTATTEAPAAPGGAGGGGGGAPITGAVIPKVKYLFDINTEILSDYLFVKPGGKIMAKITLYNFGTEEVKDAKLTNYIKNSEGEIILEGIETISVYIKSQVIKQFIIPINSSTGIYSFHADVEYNNKKAMSEAEFEVIGEEKAILPKKEPFKFKLSYLWILLVSIVIIIILYRIYMVIKGIRERKDRMVVIKDIKVLLSEKK